MATTRHAACSCGQLRVATEGDPVRISICHCHACQKRTGSAFGYQARWPRDQVEISALTERLLDTVDETMEPAFVSLWLKPVDGGGV